MPDRQSWWPYLLALLSALMAPSALRHALEETPPAPDTPAPVVNIATVTPSEKTPDPWEEFLCSYLNPKLDEPPKKDRPPTSRYCVIKEPLPPTQFLIAGVPDPEATSIPATFDVMIETLIGAAAAEDWRYDRYWLPWGADKGQEKKEEKSGSSPANPALANDQPGLLLFRNKDNHLLLVFLVGETPTSGVNKTALIKAAKFVRAHLQCKILILGPRFSGSVPSYKLAMDQLKSGPPEDVHFVTGSATRADNKRDLGRYSYEATVEHDRRTQELFLGWLESRGIPNDKVAVLAEGGTAFGASLRDSPDPTRPKAPAPGLRVEFPYQISRLRNAYEKDPELKALWLGAGSPGKDNKLAWSLKTEREDTDRVRTFQGPQTTLLQEREIEQILEEISRRGIRAVAINATDILDTVFLTLMVRRRCPNVRVFTLDSDLLFTYSSGALSFDGMMLVSPYPLWLEGQRDDQLTSNANRSVLGVHNAFIRLIGGTRYREYSPLPNQSTPPLWVTAVGRGKIWPLALLSGTTTGPPSQLVSIKATRSLTPPTPTPDWTFWMLSCVFGGLVCYGLYVYVTRQIAERGRNDRDYDPAFFFLVEPPDHTLERTVYVQTLCAFALVAFLPFAIQTHYILCGAALLVFLHTTMQEPNRKAAWATALGFCGLTAWPLFSWYRQFNTSPGQGWEQYFFNYRLLFPVGGMSPLPSWTLAWFGCAWWAVMRLNQVRAQEVRSPRLTSWPADEPLLAGLDSTVKRAHEMGNYRGFTSGFVVVVLIGLVLLLWTMPHGLASLEEAQKGANQGWTSGIQMAIILLTMLQLQSIVQLFQTQQSAMQVLQALVDHPLGDAFAALPKDLAASQLWFRGSSRQPFQSCIHAVKRLRQMMPCAAAAELASAERLMSHLLVRSAAGQRARTQEVADLHQILNRAAICAYPKLVAMWKSSTRPAQPTIEEEFVALRLGALLRYLVIQMRATVEYLSLSTVLLILAVISYPFQPQSGLVNLVTVMMALSGITVVSTVTRMDRHPVMQKFASQSNAPSFLDTLRKVAAFGFAPLVASFTALFPGSIRSLSTLIEAASKYLGGH